MKRPRQRIFEPFFFGRTVPRATTAWAWPRFMAPSKATRASFNVYSEKSHGTTFTLYLPASQKERPPAEQEERIPGGNGNRAAAGGR